MTALRDVVITGASLPGAAVLTLAAGGIFGLVTGVLLVSLSAAVTAILLAIPRSPPNFTHDDDEDLDVKDHDEKDVGHVGRVYDNIWIWKIMLLVIMFASSAVGSVYFLSGHCAETVYPQPIKKPKMQHG